MHWFLIVLAVLYLAVISRGFRYLLLAFGFVSSALVAVGNTATDGDPFLCRTGWVFTGILGLALFVNVMIYLHRRRISLEFSQGAAGLNDRYAVDDRELERNIRRGRA